MSEWVLRTERQPTRADGNLQEDVWCTRGDGSVDSAKFWSEAAQDLCIAWMPKDDKPEPYVPPKRERRIYHHGDRCSLEVLPGDPANLSALLEAIDAKCSHYDEWVFNVNEARKPREGEQWLLDHPLAQTTETAESALCIGRQ